VLEGVAQRASKRLFREATILKRRTIQKERVFAFITATMHVGQAGMEGYGGILELGSAITF
jgi:hypothetical protein